MVRYGLEGAPVLVTGAATGIGRGLAEAFARQQVRLGVVDRDAARLDIAAQELSQYTDVTPFACDLNDDAAVAVLASQVRSAFGSLQVLVNNAGTEYATPIDDPSDDFMARWRWLIDNNLISMTRVIRALAPLLSDGASVINQSSLWGHCAVAEYSAYVASKHAVLGLTRSLAWELAPRGIRVNAVCPGWVRTEASMRSLRQMCEATGRAESDVLAEILSAQPFPQLLEPIDIAGPYLFLACADSRCITGQSILASNGDFMH
ncbi:MAG: SDR family oxidoreductase [Burkholderiales bacterium]|nr:SDR family oxidoreductase [Burkholderiales bacterium]